MTEATLVTAAALIDNLRANGTSTLDIANIVTPNLDTALSASCIAVNLEAGWSASMSTFDILKVSTR